MFGYYGDDSICLRFKMKADSLEEAASIADGFKVVSARECGEALPGVYDLEIELKPADLEKLFGEAGGIRAAYRMAKAANAKMEAKHEAMEARG